MHATSADIAVERLFARLAIAPAPPIDVEALAAALGVAAVRPADLVEEGRLDRAGGMTEILVRRDAPAARRRFTIAHELAHLVLDPDGTSGEGRSAREERRCDEIAAALLMPRAWVRDAYADRPRCLATTRALAGEGDVSISAAVTRLDEVLGWGRGLLRFRRQEGRWRFLGACGVPASASGGIRSAPATSSTLDDIARRSTRDTQATVPLRLFDAVVEVPAEVSVRAGSALVLADAAALSLPTGPPPAPGAPLRAPQNGPRRSGG
jgi:uncharacterized protein DUF955